jgi:hypothetical protein
MGLLAEVCNKLNRTSEPISHLTGDTNKKRR